MSSVCHPTSPQDVDTVKSIQSGATAAMLRIAVTCRSRATELGALELQTSAHMHTRTHIHTYTRTTHEHICPHRHVHAYTSTHQHTRRLGSRIRLYVARSRDPPPIPL